MLYKLSKCPLYDPRVHELSVPLTNSISFQSDTFKASSLQEHSSFKF